MEKFIPFAKRSKRSQREAHRAQRHDWGALNPVTRKAKNSKAYDRNKARRWKDTSDTSGSYLWIALRSISPQA